MNEAANRIGKLLMAAFAGLLLLTCAPEMKGFGFVGSASADRYPWAPRPHHRVVYKYWYYPAIEVYYDPYRRVYFYVKDGVWFYSYELPPYLYPHLGYYVTLDMWTPWPYRYHRHVHRYHPPHRGYPHPPNPPRYHPYPRPKPPHWPPPKRRTHEGGSRRHGHGTGITIPDSDTRKRGSGFDRPRQPDTRTQPTPSTGTSTPAMIFETRPATKPDLPPARSGWGVGRPTAKPPSSSSEGPVSVDKPSPPSPGNKPPGAGKGGGSPAASPQFHDTPAKEQGHGPGRTRQPR